MIIKSASQRVTPRLLVDSHSGYQSRCERDPRARTGEGLFQASETYSPLQAWQALGQPTIAINANFFDIRGAEGRLLEVDWVQFAARRIRSSSRRGRPMTTTPLRR